MRWSRGRVSVLDGRFHFIWRVAQTYMLLRHAFSIDRIQSVPNTAMQSAFNAAADGPGDADATSNVRVAHPPRFDLGSSDSKAAFLNYLDEHGYAVVAAVADDAEVAAARVSFWSAAQLKAEEVLNPAAPDCESRWWLNKQTGILKP